MWKDEKKDETKETRKGDEITADVYFEHRCKFSYNYYFYYPL